MSPELNASLVENASYFSASNPGCGPILNGASGVKDHDYMPHYKEHASTITKAPRFVAPTVSCTP